MVYNHTAEGGRDGPTLSLPRPRRPRLLPARRTGRRRRDATATSPAAATPSTPRTRTALRLILDSLRYWVTEMHVDGFRFDLTPALTRTGARRRHARRASSTAIGQDPVLRHVKLIAEPWDVVDGRLPGRRVPAAVGASGTTSTATPSATSGAARLRRRPRRRVPGSPAPRDLYADDGRSPYASVNFVTAHDGFTLRDLVSYDRQAQRGQRRGQPRRHRQQPLLELRRRGRDRRPGRSSRCGAGRPRNLMATLLPVHRRADAHRRRRARPHPARQQQRLLPGQRDRPGSTGGPTTRGSTSTRSTKTALRLRREHPALRQRHFFEGRPTIERRPQGPGLDAPRRAAR